MNKTYTVGRGTAAEIRIPKVHDAVGKMHLQLEDLGGGQVRVTDLKSRNGSFLRVGKKWEEIRAPRTLPLDAEIMLGDYETTPRRLLAAAEEKKAERSATDGETPPTPPMKKRTGPRRNEFGEIVNE